MEMSNRQFWLYLGKKSPDLAEGWRNQSGMKAFFLIDKNRQIGKMYVNLEYGDNSVSIEQFRSLGRFSVIVTGKSANIIIFISNSTETNAPTGATAIAEPITRRKSLETDSPRGRGDITPPPGERKDL